MIDLFWYKCRVVYIPFWGHSGFSCRPDSRTESLEISGMPLFILAAEGGWTVLSHVA